MLSKLEELPLVEGYKTLSELAAGLELDGGWPVIYTIPECSYTTRLQLAQPVGLYDHCSKLNVKSALALPSTLPGQHFPFSRIVTH